MLRLIGRGLFKLPAAYTRYESGKTVRCTARGQDP